MSDTLSAVSHRPWPLPQEKWVMTQRWNDLLFAHWPVPVSQLANLLPSGLEIDTFDGSAWVGIVPFWMDRVRVRGLPAIPGASRFPELNLRTYVRQRNTNLSGVYFFSLDATNLLAVMVARLAFHLPYYWAKMQVHQGENGEFRYQSSRYLARRSAGFRVNYRGLGPTKELAQSSPGTIEHFLTERYCLYTVDRRGELLRGDIHHQLWPLELAEAEFFLNDLPAAHGITLPDTKPLLYYSRELAVYIWSLELALAVGQAAAVPALSAAEIV